MAITERSRHHMIARLEATLGEEAAMTLAEHLPPVGWADVATRHDFDALRTEMNLRFEALDHRFEALDHRFDAIDGRIESSANSVRAELHESIGSLRSEMVSQTRHLLVAMVGTSASFAAVMVAAVRYWA